MIVLLADLGLALLLCVCLCRSLDKLSPGAGKQPVDRQISTNRTPVCTVVANEPVCFL
jgi:hypothetical protein